MTWVLGVTAFNWGIVLLVLLFKGREAINFLVLLSATTLFLIGPVVIQNGLMAWAALESGLAWGATIGLILFPLPFLLLFWRMRTLCGLIVAAWYLGFIALALVSLAELWGLGYLKAMGIFFWPLVTVVIPVGLGIHKLLK